MPATYPTSELLGGLNATEEKYAPGDLFTAGRIELLRQAPRVAVIGSRQASERGLENSRRLAHLIVECGGVVVSGLAAGIDRAAHEGALEAGGSTIAVIGTPLDQFYPKQNQALQERLMREHLVVSQFPVGYPTQQKNFVIRNRTMALVSSGSLIVEAGANSGTMHQGWEALRLARPLFLPRSLADAAFDWPREMIRCGALVFERPSDLKELFEEHLPRASDEVLSEHPF